ncbi:MAG: dephospho-CoA kinase [Kiritimatiellaeota bacterium]|nr:dephospho-CoA kinase [Kiritimatiellota bacterium]
MNPIHAITGGIACGKSAFAGFLAEAGCEILDADDLSRVLQAPGGAALPAIRAAFGPAVFQPGGGLDRAALARVVFNDPGARRELEAIMHPPIRAAFDAWRAQPAATTRAAIIPLLFETGWQDDWPRVTCVACTPELQMERLRSRGLSEADALARVRAQMPLAEKVGRAHETVWNNGTLAELRAKALQWIEKTKP